MITDEQVIKALDVYYGIEHVGGARESLIEGMRKALEAYEANKWVKFDVDDESTWPQRKGHHIVFDGRNVMFKYWDSTLGGGKQCEPIMVCF